MGGLVVSVIDIVVVIREAATGPSWGGTADPGLDEGGEDA